MKFSDLIPGDLFRTVKGGAVYLVPNFDIFSDDHVIRTQQTIWRVCVTVTGSLAGQRSGPFYLSESVERVRVGVGVMDAHKPRWHSREVLNRRSR